MNEEEFKKFEEFNEEIHKEVKKAIESTMKKYSFVKKVNYKLTIDV